ncbi:MAG TPA: membrane protein insertion efficiency factor YidD [Albitalea sp.]|uniref:membrane protein insertion efficiency factor YidD n=1 Tax=Piscinibacter sp. TaxID=1903157 RepID=UPI002ED22673
MALLRLLADLPRRALMALVRFYRFFLSPWLGTRCLYLPTCSAYALEALERHGAVAGSVLTAGRLLRCAPWCAGGHDPVPDAPLRLFSRLVPGVSRNAEPSSLSREKNIP